MSSILKRNPNTQDNKTILITHCFYIPGVLELHLVQREAHRLQTQYQSKEPPEEATQRQKQHSQYLQPRSNKRISLPDNFSYTNTSLEPVQPVQLQTAMQHRWDDTTL